MTHYVMLKYKEGSFTDALIEDMKGIYSALEQEVAGIEKATVHVNCLEDPLNFDLMVELKLTEKAALQDYLEHPRHIAMAEKFADVVALRHGFDCE